MSSDLPFPPSKVVAKREKKVAKMGRAAEMGSLIQTVITEPRSHGQDGCCCPAQARPRTHFPAIAASKVGTCNPSFDRGPTEGFTVTSLGYWLRAGWSKKRGCLQVARATSAFAC